MTVAQSMEKHYKETKVNRIADQHRMEANRKADMLRLDKQFDFMTNESAKNDKREDDREKREEKRLLEEITRYEEKERKRVNEKKIDDARNERTSDDLLAVSINNINNYYYKFYNCYDYLKCYDYLGTENIREVIII